VRRGGDGERRKRDGGETERHPHEGLLSRVSKTPTSRVAAPRGRATCRHRSAIGGAIPSGSSKGVGLRSRSRP
jgi:hypothetical protein